MTASSRRVYSPRAWPRIVSDTPTEYMSAVSKKLTPASIALRKNGRASSSSSTHGRHFFHPYVIVPRQRRQTFKPVWPRLTHWMDAMISSRDRAPPYFPADFSHVPERRLCPCSR